MEKVSEYKNHGRVNGSKKEDTIWDDAENARNKILDCKKYIYSYTYTIIHLCM
jgi:hypothetical protein